MGTPTKKVSFDTTTIDALRTRLKWDETGKSVKLDGNDPVVYKKVAAVFTLLNGKWNRSAQATLFDRDMRPTVDDIIANGFFTKIRDGFFPTPQPIIDEMLREVAVIGDLVLEPSAGDGAIIKAVQAYAPGTKVDWFELNPERAEQCRALNSGIGVCADFLTITPNPVYDTVLMNPPFENGQWMEHIMHAWKFLAVGGVMIAIAPPGTDAPRTAKEKEYAAWLAAHTWVSFDLPEGSFKASGTAVSTRMLVVYG